MPNKSLTYLTMRINRQKEKNSVCLYTLPLPCAERLAPHLDSLISIDLI
jgi:hypothetical protein